MEKRILIVEDDERLGHELERAFRRRGHPTLVAGSLAALRSLEPRDADWAVVDLALPDGSGLAGVEWLKQRNPEIRVVVLTGYGSIASTVAALRRGAIDYLAKPVDVDQLLAALAPETEPRDAATPLQAPSLERVEWEHIQRVLQDCGGNVTRAAKALRIHRRTLQRKLAYRPPSR